MKNLLYKEFKLSVHPLTYVLIVLLAMAGLSPYFPSFIPLLYMGVTYTVLFIGMNKTTTTNDLYYTCTLPIRREDVVKARVLSTSIIQLIEIVLIFAFLSISTFVFNESIKEVAKETGAESAQISLNMKQGIVLFAVYLISFAVFDLIYLPWFYKNGKSIILNMFVGIIAMAFVGALLTIIPYFTAREILTVGHPKANYFIQFGILLVAIGLWIGSKILVIKLSAENLKKLDF